MIKGLAMVMTMLVAGTCLPYSFETGGKKDDKTFSIYVNVQPDLGWKWNNIYPSSFRVKIDDSDHGKHKFINGKIAMEYFSTTKSTDVLIIASFSLCTKKLCRSFRNKEFHIKLGAKEFNEKDN